MDEAKLSEGEAPPPRLGLALSGGGFRAAFFHLGVLARMAELDLLREVQVLSTVSGGSVIGAMYYLKVRDLLQQHPDDKIRRECYENIVAELERDFYVGVRRNLRMRTFANPFKNWRMYSRRYSRSDRIAELYTDYLFAPLFNHMRGQKIRLKETRIQPACEDCGFHPFDSAEKGTKNDSRCNKVPILLLNATTLNTGHNFRFTSTWMGEAPTRGARSEIDQNTRLRRARFSNNNLPEKYRKLPLDIAVAASTAVPGVFHPLALTDLYPGWTPQLVDGGVHDNQGIEGLLDFDCTHLVVSDACGLMKDDPNPSTRMISVLKRSNSVMMDRIREEMYETVQPREGGRIQELTFLHLRQELQGPELGWGEGEQANGTVQGAGGPTTYGVDKEIQLRLSRVRTDLDSFSEVEAQALMADGYLIAKSQITSALAQERDPSCPADAQSCACRWGFLRVAPYLANPKLDPLFARQLEISSQIAFKVFARFPWLRWTARGLGLVLTATLLWYMICVNPCDPVEFARILYEHVNTHRELGLTVLALLLYGVLFLLPRRLRWVAMLRDLPRLLALRAGTATIAAAAAWLHILVFDRLFLWQGRVDRLKNGP